MVRRQFIKSKLYYKKTPTENICFKINGDEMATFELTSYYDFTSENCTPKYHRIILADKQEFKGLVNSVNYDSEVLEYLFSPTILGYVIPKKII